jgi:hypothetical protein
MLRATATWVAAIGLLLLSMGGWLARRERPSAMRALPAPSPSANHAAPPPPPARPIAVETVPVIGDLPAFVLRSSSSTPAGQKARAFLFVSGMCAHPVGYVQSFQPTAAAHGDFMIVQGDVSCGGDGSMRRWSSDLEAMNRRIQAAFHAADLGEPSGVTVIGYSQGAERVERLVARWPDRYSSAILISSPVVPSSRALAKAKAVILMVGSLEGQDQMRSAVGPLTHAGVPARFFALPGARHGQLGPEPSNAMGQALDFIDEMEEVKRSGAPGVTSGPVVR